MLGGVAAVIAALATLAAGLGGWFSDPQANAKLDTISLEVRALDGKLLEMKRELIDHRGEHVTRDRGVVSYKREVDAQLESFE